MATTLKGKVQRNEGTEDGRLIVTLVPVRDDKGQAVDGFQGMTFATPKTDDTKATYQIDAVVPVNIG